MRRNPPNKRMKPTALSRVQISGRTRIVVGLLSKILTPNPRGGLCASVRLTRSRKLRGRLTNLTAELTAKLVDSLVSPVLAIDRPLRISPKAKATSTHPRGG